MRDILEKVKEWTGDGLDVGLATVISTWGSAPRGVSAKMAFTRDGAITGSVSGGCIEGAVFDMGIEVLEGAEPRLAHFGVADETAWDVGLACGGQIDVFIDRLNQDDFLSEAAAYESDQPFATATCISGEPIHVGKKLLLQGGVSSGGIDPKLDSQIIEMLISQQETGQSAVKKLEREAAAGEELEIFIEIVQSKRRLIIVGGVHIAVALASVAKSLDYKTIVVDPRRAFSSEERFPHVDQLIQKWPKQAFNEIELTSSTAVAILTHDPKIDDPAVKAVLSSPVFYIGALGSRSTHEKRRQRLLADGVSAEDFARIHGPIGLDIGAQTPEEIAVSIMAQIIEHQRR